MCYVNNNTHSHIIYNARRNILNMNNSIILLIVKLIDRYKKVVVTICNTHDNIISNMCQNSITHTNTNAKKRTNIHSKTNSCNMYSIEDMIQCY